MKKLCFALALILMLLPLGVIAQAGDLPPIPLTTKHVRVAGDANGDGVVDLVDVAVTSRYLAGGWNVTVDEDAADVNGDHVVNLKDTALIRRYLAGGWNVTLI